MRNFKTISFLILFFSCGNPKTWWDGKFICTSEKCKGEEIILVSQGVSYMLTVPKKFPAVFEYDENSKYFIHKNEIFGIYSVVVIKFNGSKNLLLVYSNKKDVYQDPLSIDWSTASSYSK